MSLSVVTFVPMRHSSERVPGKNYRPFNGVPLFHRIVSTLPPGQPREHGGH